MGGVIQFPKHRTRLSFCDLLTDGCLAFDDECVRTVPTPRKPPVPRVPPPRVPPEPKPRVQPDPSRPTTTPSRRRRTKRTLFAHPRLIIEVQISLRTSADGIGVSGTSNDYDAFGTTINQTGAVTDQPYLFTGERYDATLGLYHLRARYMEPWRGRLWSQDSFEGADAEPLSLHKYAYCLQFGPTNGTDPSGNTSLLMALAPTFVINTLAVSHQYLGGLSPKNAMMQRALTYAMILAQNVLISIDRWLEYPDQKIYERWFGPPSAQNVAEVRAMYSRVQSKISSDRTDIAMVVDDNPPNPRAIAGCYPGGAVTIYCYPLFFSIPAIPTRDFLYIDNQGNIIRDRNQASALLHEFSHEFLNTGDNWPDKSAIPANAANSPNMAVKNSFSYNFYADDVYYLHFQ